MPDAYDSVGRYFTKNCLFFAIHYKFKSFHDKIVELRWVLLYYVEVITAWGYAYAFTLLNVLGGKI